MSGFCAKLVFFLSAFIFVKANPVTNSASSFCQMIHMFSNNRHEELHHYFLQVQPSLASKAIEQCITLSKLEQTTENLIPSFICREIALLGEQRCASNLAVTIKELQIQGQPCLFYQKVLQNVPDENFISLGETPGRQTIPSVIFSYMKRPPPNVYGDLTDCTLACSQPGMHPVCQLAVSLYTSTDDEIVSPSPETKVSENKLDNDGTGQSKETAGTEVSSGQAPGTDSLETETRAPADEKALNDNKDDNERGLVDSRQTKDNNIDDTEKKGAKTTAPVVDVKPLLTDKPIVNLIKTGGNESASDKKNESLVANAPPDPSAKNKALPAQSSDPTVKSNKPESSSPSAATSSAGNNLSAADKVISSDNKQTIPSTSSSTTSTATSTTTTTTTTTSSTTTSTVVPSPSAEKISKEKGGDDEKAPKAKDPPVASEKQKMDEEKTESGKESAAGKDGKNKQDADGSKKEDTIPAGDESPAPVGDAPDQDLTKGSFLGDDDGDEAFGGRDGPEDESPGGGGGGPEEPSNKDSEDVQNGEAEPEGEGIKQAKEAPENTKSRSTGVFPEQEDSHFFAYFLTVVIIIILVYLIVHNKQKILGLIVEGRGGQRRRSHSYRKLDNEGSKGSQMIF